MYTNAQDDKEPDMHKYYFSKLYRYNAFHILWKWHDHNMKKGGIDKILILYHTLIYPYFTFAS